MADEQESPLTQSSDYDSMIGYWTMVNAILAGAEALRATAAGNVAGPQVPYGNLSQLKRGGYAGESPYLPRFPRETTADYDCRRRKAFLTNIYGDISGNLASKPFSKECTVADDTDARIKQMTEENVDGLGNNLHVFAGTVFKTALDKGITWIMVEFTKVPPSSTLADERNMGAGPYWVHVPAENLIAVYSNFINGREIIFHARISEPSTELVGYTEVTYNRVRELTRDPIFDAKGNIIGYGPAMWAIKEEVTDKDAITGKEKATWIIKDSGLITLGFIPLVPLIIGRRIGKTWRVDPALRDLAFMQIKLFQKESNFDTICDLTAFPMLAGNGVNPRRDQETGNIIPEITVGPHAVLFAEMDGEGHAGSWNYIGPPADCLTFLETSSEKYRGEMRDLGMQPLTAANLTVITTANISMKAHSALQRWTLALKDALEQALKFTSIWLGQKTSPEVVVHMDFGVDLEGGKNVDGVLKAEAQGLISKKEGAMELQRLGVLRDDYDYEEDQIQLADEQANNTLTPEAPIVARNGQPIPPMPPPPPNRPPPLQAVK